MSVSINAGSIMAALQQQARDKAEAARQKSRQGGETIGMITGAIGAAVGTVIAPGLGTLAGWQAGQNIGASAAHAFRGDYEAQDTQRLISGLTSAGSMMGQIQTNELAGEKLAVDKGKLEVEQAATQIAASNLEVKQQTATAELIGQGWRQATTPGPTQAGGGQYSPGKGGIGVSADAVAPPDAAAAVKIGGNLLYATEDDINFMRLSALDRSDPVEATYGSAVDGGSFPVRKSQWNNVQYWRDHPEAAEQAGVYFLEEGADIAAALEEYPKGRFIMGNRFVNLQPGGYIGSNSPVAYNYSMQPGEWEELSSTMGLYP